MGDRENGQRSLREASKKNFATEKFFVTAEDQIHITEPDTGCVWKLNIRSISPMTIGVIECQDDTVVNITKDKGLVADKLYRLGGRSIFLMTSSKSGDGLRMLKMVGPNGTVFAKVDPDPDPDPDPDTDTESLDQPES